jgi:hypothetical protein
MASPLFQVLAGGLTLALGAAELADVPGSGSMSDPVAVETTLDLSTTSSAASSLGNDVALAPAASSPAASSLPTSAPQTPAEAASRPPLAESVTIPTSLGVLYLPRGFASTQDGRFDLVVHFHGGAQIVAPQMERARVNAALFVVNLGVGSGVYENAFEGGRPLESRIAFVEDKLRERGIVPAAKASRVALSAWSAGYGAVSKILTASRTAERVDSVLLADGLHAGFERGSRTAVDSLKMAPFARFAKRAADGKALMGISHSRIATYRYASTTQTADYLIDSVSASREPTGGATPAVGGGSAAKRGDFYVVGFGGDDTDAHCEHLTQLGETLFPVLAEHWRTPAR